MKSCQFGTTITQNTEPVFDEKPYKLQELTEEVAVKMTEQFLVGLIATVSTNRPIASTSLGNAA